MADHQAPPYPYQQQPLQGHHSGDYAAYPQLSEEQQQQNDQRYGTPVMGAPSNPSAHPDNQHAATGSFSSQSSHGSSHANAQASRTQAAPGVTGHTQDPYVQSSSTATTPGKGSMDHIRAQVSELSKKAEIAVNNMWGHLSTGGSVADNAWGRVTAGTQLLTKGGFEGVFKSTFPADADEKLKKTYACFLSTSTGPVGGTLFISTKKIAFCSDRPLSYTPANGQQSFSYYKVIVPANKVKEVNPSVNQNKPAEKYIQVTTEDKYEFWFMGFVNYDKGVKNLQAVVGTGNHPTGGSHQEPYPPNQSTAAPYQQSYSPHQSETYSSNQSEGGYHQQPYPPNQPTHQGAYPPNQYGTPAS